MAGSIESNAGAVIRALAPLPDCLSPRGRLPGGRRVGDELADAIAEAVRRRTADQQRQPDGAPLAPLKAAYRRRKLRAGHDGRILIRTGEMLDRRQLRGRVTVTKEVLVMEGGTDDEVNRRMQWATRGDRRRNRPKRPFYEPGRDGTRAALAVLREAAAAALLRARLA